ncbi:MAG: alcohol dehydrogenase catalytic domain-containing protein, partial [Candidatus Poribacteria bacterium]|nr:alcohol dehydrogenase catalytic domain-containing protein [Candidatus Poribacteria bacterium]
MRAVVIDAPETMRLGEWERSPIGAGDARVSVAAAGVCAGDMYIYLGKNPYSTYPVVAGHEVSGVVEEVGESVEGVEVGDRVVVEPFLGCGTCYPCRVGKSNCCVRLQIIGVHRPGGYAESVVAPATHVHRVPEGLSLRDAAFAEPVAIAVQACRRGDVSADDTVLILGCGPIGLALIEVAKARGASVYATDIASSRLEMGERL